MFNLERGATAQVNYGFKTIEVIVSIPNRLAIGMDHRAIGSWKSHIIRSVDDHLEIVLVGDQNAFDTASDIMVSVKQLIRF